MQVIADSICAEKALPSTYYGGGGGINTGLTLVTLEMQFIRDVCFGELTRPDSGSNVWQGEDEQNFHKAAILPKASFCTYNVCMRIYLYLYRHTHVLEGRKEMKELLYLPKMQVRLINFSPASSSSHITSSSLVREEKSYS